MSMQHVYCQKPTAHHYVFECAFDDDDFAYQLSHIPQRHKTAFIVPVTSFYIIILHDVLVSCFLVQQSDIGAVLTQLEKLTLIIACLCHDIDHRGTNNAFQKK